MLLHVKSAQPSARFLAVRSSSNTTDDMQGKIGSDVEKKNADFEDRHPGVMQHVKLLPGEMKPSAVEKVNPVVRKYKDQEPQ